MSDDINMIRRGIMAARDRRTVSDFNDEIGDAIERDALAALERLQEQLRKQADEWNEEMALLGQGIAEDIAEKRALRERAEKAEKELRDTETNYTAFEKFATKHNAALQERIDTALKAMDERSPFFVELREILSPTKETDPGDDLCAPSWCRKPRSHKVHMTAKDIAREIHPSGTHRFQETDR